MENKVCHNCWNYTPARITNRFHEDHVSLKCSSYCDFHKDSRSVRPEDTCENWESKMLKLICVVKTLYSR